MKKVLVCFCCFINFFVLSNANAADTKNKTGTDGCGLGWQVTEKKTLSATTTRGTTNSVLPPTYSMTSGTSGCDSHGFISKVKQSQHFAEVNFEAIVADISIGEGEYLATYLQTLGCENSNTVKSAFRNNFEQIVTTKNASELQTQVNSIIKSNKQLNSSCFNS
jgi:hypothetical protein